MTKIRISISAILVWLLLPLLFQSEGIFLLLTLMCSILHELFHLAAFHCCGAKAQEITIFPFGISVQRSALLEISGKQEIFCALAGPLCNFFLAGGAWLFPTATEPLRSFLLYCNLSLAIINLLPVLPLDGGRIFYFILTCP